jgi:hypothetical protein
VERVSGEAPGLEQLDKPLRHVKSHEKAAETENVVPVDRFADEHCAPDSTDLASPGWKTVIVRNPIEVRSPEVQAIGAVQYVRHGKTRDFITPHSKDADRKVLDSGDASRLQSFAKPGRVNRNWKARLQRVIRLPVPYCAAYSDPRSSWPRLNPLADFQIFFVFIKVTRIAHIGSRHRVVTFYDRIPFHLKASNTTI